MGPLQSGTNNIITYTSPEASARHRLSNSNYATEGTRNAVATAVAQYAQEYGMPNYIFLPVIDMSLPIGGGFDVAGGWERDVRHGAVGHEFHRIGKSVDFSHFYRDASGRVITVYIYVDGEIRRRSNRIDENELDRFFDLEGFDRWERPINLIHYESRN